MSYKFLNRTNQNLQVQDTNTTKKELHIEFDRLTQNQPNYIKRIFRDTAEENPDNALIICDYINAEQAEINIQESTKGDKIKKLYLLSRFFHHRKNFTQINKNDILNYLNSLRKSNDDDPTHKSIGTYNGRQMVFLKFFRWLYNPNEPDHRKRITPPCMVGVKSLPRKEKSAYQPGELWTADDHKIFLKYCPSARDRCWHTMAYDASTRPHEILNLRIGDIHWKISSDGVQYAEIHVDGKTGPRTLPLINSIPYIKEWLTSHHPFGNNPDSKLFVPYGKANFGQSITRDGMLKHYQSYYRDILFPSLMRNPAVPAEDREAIRKLPEKRWNLYIFRHSALTQKSQILKEATLRDHAGWSMNSKIPSVYLHYFGTESCNSLLEASGIIKKESAQATHLFSSQCPSCNEPNKNGAKFCVGCKTVLRYDSFFDTLQKEQQKELEIKDLKEKLEEQNQKFDRILEMIQYNPKLARLKPEVLMTRKPVNK